MHISSVLSRNVVFGGKLEEPGGGGGGGGCEGGKG